MTDPNSSGRSSVIGPVYLENNNKNANATTGVEFSRQWSTVGPVFWEDPANPYGSDDILVNGENITVRGIFGGPNVRVSSGKGVIVMGCNIGTAESTNNYGRVTWLNNNISSSSRGEEDMTINDLSGTAFRLPDKDLTLRTGTTFETAMHNEASRYPSGLYRWDANQWVRFQADTGTTI